MHTYTNILLIQEMYNTNTKINYKYLNNFLVVTKVKYTITK